MAIRHTVQAGDSLWSLAHRYLGSGARYQEIVKEHNHEAAACFGSHYRLLAIQDPNLIYIGQTIMVPSRKKLPQPGTGKRQESSTIATGLGLKLEYNFEDGKNPIKYMPIVTKDYTITSQMTGKITIENLTHDKHRHNFEIAMAADKNQLTSKLGFGDKAIAELTKSLESNFNITTGKVTLKASIAAHANIGPYTFEVKADAPNHFSYTFKPDQISAIVEKDRRKYKFVAEIAFKVNVTLHPLPLKVNPDAIEERVSENSSKSMGLAVVAGLILAYIAWVIYGPKGPVLQPAPGLSTPFLYSIDPNNSGPSA